MISNKIFFIMLLFMFFACVEDPPPIVFDFPKVTMKAFKPRLMEQGVKNISYIRKTPKGNTISLVVAWKELDNRSGLKGIRLYLQKDRGKQILIKEEDIESRSSVISKELEYDVRLNFTLFLVNDLGEESPSSNSNTVSIFLSYGEPDKLEAVFDKIKTDSLVELKLTWENGSNGNANKVFNITHQRNGLLDSISINVEKKRASDWERTISIFAASREICIDNGESDKTRSYVINIARLKNSVRNKKATVLKNFNENLFNDKNIDNLFAQKGKYRVSFYLYKNFNGVLNIHKTNFIENIEIK